MNKVLPNAGICAPSRESLSADMGPYSEMPFFYTFNNMSSLTRVCCSEGCNDGCNVTALTVAMRAHLFALL
jgi:hypothetical protein